MEDVIPAIEHVDHIFTDPPYLYIKTHDFDKEFDEGVLFENARRILPNEGFIALFGRGASFYRWNTRLAELGFVFKEEIVWDKILTSSPVSAVSRVHETVSLHTKRNGKIRKAKVPYVEQKQYRIETIVDDINRITGAIGSEKGLESILEFIKSGTKRNGEKRVDRHTITIKGLMSRDRAVSSLSAIKEGMREKTIISVCPVHYGSVHPTEKPVRLAERIIALISDAGDVIYDPFMGSGAIGVACVRTGRKYIGSEINAEYFEIAYKRIKAEQPLLVDGGGG
jgi:site-specific DNA-methyltransferase (adenine-specific)